MNLRIARKIFNAIDPGRYTVAQVVRASRRIQTAAERQPRGYQSGLTDEDRRRLAATSARLDELMRGMGRD